MPDRDGYIAGVPCWIDTTQPDPDAATEFYGALFGWEYEQTMPEDAPGKYYMARIRGRDAAAVSSQMGEDAQPAVWNTYIQVDSADETAEKVKAAGGSVMVEPFDIFDSGRMAFVADPQGAAFGLWQPNQHLGTRVDNEHGAINFNDLHTDRHRGRQGVLRRGVRLGDARHGRRQLHLDAEGVRRPPRGAQPGPARAHEGDGRAGQLHRRRRKPRAGTGRRPAELGRDVRGRRRRRDRRQGARARRRGPGRPVRRAVGAARGRPRPAGGDVHRRPVRGREQGHRAGHGRPPPRASSARARPHRSAARPPCRAAGRGRCRAGRSSRSW